MGAHRPQLRVHLGECGAAVSGSVTWGDHVSYAARIRDAEARAEAAERDLAAAREALRAITDSTDAGTMSFLARAALAGEEPAREEARS